MAEMASGGRPVRPKGDLVASRVSAQLREELLAMPDGAFVGLEDELLAKYHVSRPTLRQAARVLESEQLLAVRRGVGGGYYARQPNMDAVGRVAASFLKSRRTNLHHMLQTARALMRGMATTAASSPNVMARARLQVVYDQMLQRRPDAIDMTEFHKLERQLGVGIVALADNPTLELFMAVLYQVGLGETRLRIFEDRPDRMAVYWRLRLGLVEAILRGDAEVTEVMSGRWSEQLMSWVREEMGEAAAGPAPAGGDDEEWV